MSNLNFNDVMKRLRTLDNLAGKPGELEHAVVILQESCLIVLMDRMNGERIKLLGDAPGASLLIAKLNDLIEQCLRSEINKASNRLRQLEAFECDFVKF